MGRPVDFYPMPRAGGLDGWSLPALLHNRALRTPNAAAYRFKRRGIYHELSWQLLWRQTRKLAGTLERFGVKAGDRIGLMAAAYPAAVLAEHAIWAARAVSVGIYPTASAYEISHILKHSAARLLIVQGQEQLDRLMTTVDALGVIDTVIILNGKGIDLSEYGDLTAIHVLDDLLSQPDVGDLSAAPALDPNALACITYTSGTTGRPKGVMHSHRSMLYGADSKRVLVPELTRREQRTIVSVPFTHISPKSSAVLLPLISRLVPHFPEGSETVRDTIIDVRPTYIVQPPRFYEKLSNDVLSAVSAGSSLRRFCYGQAMKVANGVVSRRWQKKRIPALQRFLYAFARVLVFRPILRQIGYSKLRHAYVGSAPTHSKLIHLWHSWGLDLRESYGLTESGGNITAQQRAFPAPGDIGPVLAREDYVIKIAEDGELLFRGPSNFIGYWGDTNATQSSLVDGWLQTGDIVAQTTDESVSLTGRKSQVITTSGGKTLSPERIEFALKTSPFVADAVAVGHGRQFISAIIEIELTRLSAWAAEKGVAAEGYEALATHPEVLKLLDREIEKVNAQLGWVERIRRFSVAPSAFSTLSGVYTAMQKLRREEVIRQLAPLVEAMYLETEPMSHVS
jgi:long-chain acyl-CoA synthetase